MTREKYVDKKLLAKKLKLDSVDESNLAETKFLKENKKLNSSIPDSFLIEVSKLRSTAFYTADFFEARFLAGVI